MNLPPIKQTSIIAGWIASVRAVGWPWLVYGFGCLLDLVSTGILFQTEGTEAEVHPVIRYVGEFVGSWPTAIIGKTAQTAALLFLFLFFREKTNRMMVLIVGIGYICAGAVNTYHIFY